MKHCENQFFSVIVYSFLVILCLKFEFGGANRARPFSKIVIDTDAGSDDALAIAEIILASQKNSPSINILGITCVTGNTKVKNVVVNVLKVLRVLKEPHIPVYIGADRPLLVEPHFDNFFGLDGLGDVPFPNPPKVCQAQSKNAVNALIDIAASHPGEVTVIALGPLTNIALASRMDPHFRSNLKHLLVLGGIFGDNGTAPNGAEFNFFFDPHAAAMVFKDTMPGMRPITQLTTGVTLNPELTLDWRWNTFSQNDTPIVDFLNKIEKKAWNETKVTSYKPFDALIAAAFISSKVVESTSAHYEEVLTCGNDLGKVVLKDDNCYKNAVVIDGIDTKTLSKLLVYLLG